MGERTLYPAPRCPDCNGTSRVKNTAYTDDGRILRNRECSWCTCSWWTLQQPENSIDRVTHRVVLPKSFKNNKHLPAQLLRVESCTPSQSSSA
jgi:transcriptional regulator NrdR family protein